MKKDFTFELLLTGLVIGLLIGLLLDGWQTYQSGSLSVLNTVSSGLSSVLLYLILKPLTQSEQEEK